MHTHETLPSWLGVHKQDSMVLHANSVADLERITKEYPSARPIGKLHSYNRSALHPLAIRLGDAFDYVEYDSDLTKWRIGGAATIEKVMKILAVHGYRLPNSGNHRQQTFIGACVGGTHGFGTEATMMDSVIDQKKIGSVIHEVTIEAVELTSFVVKHCVCPLSKLTEQSASNRSYAVLPYSGDDPIAIVSEYRPFDMGEMVEELATDIQLGKPIGQFNRHKTWWRIKAVQWAQKTFRWVPRRLQKLLNIAKMKTWYSVTAETDIDALYHPWPEADNGPIRGSRWLYWSQRPTYQYYNIAFACKPEDTLKAFNVARKAAGKHLAGFIGVREMTTKSEYEKALNFDGPRNSVDLYFYPEDSDLAHYVQQELRVSELDLRWHPSKHLRAI